MDLQSSHEAALAVSTLRLLLRHVGSCDGKMEDGSLRVNVIVSVAPVITLKEEDEEEEREEKDGETSEVGGAD